MAARKKRTEAKPLPSVHQVGDAVQLAGYLVVTAVTFTNEGVTLYELACSEAGEFPIELPSQAVLRVGRVH